MDRHLVHVETGTLLSLCSRDRLIRISHMFDKQYYPPLDEFSGLFFLVLSYPNTVPYNDLIAIISEVSPSIESRAQIDKMFAKIKSDLKSFGVKDLIIKTKSRGYAISNKWVHPEEISEYSIKKRFAKMLRLVAAMDSVQHHIGTIEHSNKRLT